MAVCLTCGSEFVPYRTNWQLFCQSSCRDKARRNRATTERKIQLQTANKKYRQSKKEYIRDYHLRSKFGITTAQYEELLEKQGGGCAICGKTPEQEKRSLAVDHLHKPPYSIRGILCFFCNHKVIGRHTKPDVLRKAADYLETDTGLFAPPPKRKTRKPRGKS